MQNTILNAASPSNGTALRGRNYGHVPALIEALFAVLSCILLWHLAQPLARTQNHLGLGDRYESTSAQVNPLPEPPGAPVSWVEGMRNGVFAPFGPALSSRARWLHAHSGFALMLVGIAGWLALWLGRSSLSIFVRVPGILALWAAVGYCTASFTARAAVASAAIAYAWLAALALALLGVVVALAMTGSRWRDKASPIAIVPWVYPGWVLLGGVGCLWLIDYAARGYPKHRFSGVYQFDAWLLATAVLTLAAVLAPIGLAALSRFLARWEGGRTGPALPLLGVLLLWLLPIALVAHVFGLGQLHAATIAELLRVPVWLGLGWVAYRWVESGLRPVAGLISGAILLAALAGSLLAVDDQGPILAQAVAVVVVLGGLAAAAVGRTWLRPLGLAVGVTMAAAFLLAIGWALFTYAPAERLAALQHPHQGRLEFLSEIRWFLHAVPKEGFGLARVPWCGYAASIGAAKCAGVPQQIQSDYVFAALVAVWGHVGGIMLIALLLLWLTALVASRIDRSQGRVLDLDLLATWLIIGGATAYAAQTVISTLGALGVIPLTGVSIPLFSYGGSSLLTVALLCSLAANRHPPISRKA